MAESQVAGPVGLRDVLLDALIELLSSPLMGQSHGGPPERRLPSIGLDRFVGSRPPEHLTKGARCRVIGIGGGSLWCSDILDIACCLAPLIRSH